MEDRHQETSAFHYRHSEEVEMGYKSQGLAYRRMEASYTLRRVQFFSFHNCRANWCVKAAQVSLQP